MSLLELYKSKHLPLLYWKRIGDSWKGPRAKDWPTRPYPLDKFDPETMNLGVFTGSEISPGKFLIDGDLDWPPGVVLAKRLLPPTNFGFKRVGKPISHCFWTSSARNEYRKYTDITETGTKPVTFIELRSGNLTHQTMIAPSVHSLSSTGEPVVIELAQGGDIAHVEATALDHAVLDYAIGCLLLKRVLGGLNHEGRLALSGMLLKAGMTPERATNLLTAVCEAQGRDISDCSLVVSSTAAKIAGHQPVAGTQQFIDFCGDRGRDIATLIQRWLGVADFLNAKNKPVANDCANIQLAFDKLGAKIHYDTFSQKPMIALNGAPAVPLQDIHRINLRMAIEKQFKFRPSSEYFDDVLLHTAYGNQKHPVTDYLADLKWDGTPRIETWLKTYGGAADTPYTRAVGRLTLLAAVTRVRRPGCKFDFLLVLESSIQGKNKSSMLRSLCADSSWFSDDLPLDVDAKQLIERTAGKWIIEASELSGMRESRMEHLKSLLSRQVDGPVRLAYAHLPVEVPRQFILVGSTNLHHYLTDVTGNRRFWPVRVSEFDVEGIRRDRDQLWAEAALLESEGATLELPPDLYEAAGLQQERRRTEHPWESVLGAYFQGFPEDVRIAPDELWEILGISVDRLAMKHQHELSAVMQQLGFRRMAVTNRNGKVVKGYARGSGKRDLLPLG